MVYESVQTASSWSPTLHKSKSSWTPQPTPVQTKSVPVPSSGQQVPSISPVASDWMSRDPVLQRLSSQETTVQRQCSKCEQEESVQTQTIQRQEQSHSSASNQVQLSENEENSGGERPLLDKDQSQNSPLAADSIPPLTANAKTVASGEENTQFGGTTRLTCFAERNRKLKVVWTLISADEPISEYNLELLFNNNERRTAQGNVRRPNKVVSGSETVQFPQNWSEGEVQMTGTANLRVSVTPPSFSVKLILPITDKCEFGNTPTPFLYRFGTDYESPTRLNNQAQAAENSRIGIHGVSVSQDPKVGPPEKSVADRGAVERFFRVHPTPTNNDRLHHTVQLPKPVTKDDAHNFNGLFGRQSSR